jgi:hypothetical protein
MARLADMTANQICELRLKCVEAYITVASKMDITQEAVLVKGENLFAFCIKGLDQPSSENPAVKAPGKKGQS